MKLPMPYWFPHIIILMGAFGIADICGSEISRGDLVVLSGIIIWAILSKNNEVKNVIDPNEVVK